MKRKKYSTAISLFLTASAIWFVLTQIVHSQMLAESSCKRIISKSSEKLPQNNTSEAFTDSVLKTTNDSYHSSSKAK
ncbi:MAG: hypothetical protein SGI87_03740 [Flavobacteriales bacterium]|nr:hypothetical protein [Flavobacteriales bacterium]